LLAELEQWHCRPYDFDNFHGGQAASLMFRVLVECWANNTCLNSRSGELAMRRCGSRLGLVVGCFVFGACRQAMAQVPGVLAQVDEPQDRSFLLWVLQCLGLFGTLAALAGLVIFFGSLIIVFATRRPAVIASYLVFLPLPMLLAVAGALKGLVNVFSVSTMSGIELKQNQITGALAEVLVLPLSALLTIIPSLIVVGLGLFVRTLSAERGIAAAGRQPQAGPTSALHP
jgi:hypothetical protein